MLFSSMTFIFLFMPIVCIIYLLARKNLQNIILLLASLLFYAWGGPNYLAIMLLTILINYIAALFLEKTTKYKKLFLFLTICANLGILIYFKYCTFLIENINSLLQLDIPLLEIIMPIGVSFYTFQAMSYVIDVYRGEVKAQRNIYKIALYISLFPQLVAGPIVKYHDIDHQIDNRTVNFRKVTYGVKRFIIGLSKKMLLANTLGVVADKIFSQPVEQFDTATAWIGAVAYALQLFYDFSGYSDMAIGLGYIFGFKFLENFNYPYISRSITEFWRRWHISLSTWFKEYLYIPLGGNRISPSRTYINLFIVFLATGIWHGASWNFIFWGLWNGFFIILERITNWHKKEGAVIQITQHIYTIFIFLIGWVMFRSETMPYAWEYLKNMFGLIPEHDIAYDLSYYIDHIEMITFSIAILCSMPVFSKILALSDKHTLVKCFVNTWLLILFIVSTAMIASSTYNPFIYFRF